MGRCAQNLHVRSWLQLHCAWKNHERSFASFNVFILFHGKCSPCRSCSGKFHQNAWMVSTGVDTQQHLPPSRRLRIWFSMIWRSSADRPSSSGRYPLLNYFTLRIIEDWFINIHCDSSIFKSDSKHFLQNFSKQLIASNSPNLAGFVNIYISPCTAAAALELAVEIQAKSCWPISIQNLVVWMEPVRDINRCSQKVENTTITWIIWI